jgi:hypothetical protein
MEYTYLNHPLFPIVESINGKSGAVTIKTSDSLKIDTSNDGHLEISFNSPNGITDVEGLTITERSVAIGKEAGAPDIYQAVAIG